MKIGILKETRSEEHRVAAVPATVAKMVKENMTVFVETNAGSNAAIQDREYQEAGATIVADSASLLQTIDVLLKVQSPSLKEMDLMKKGTILIAPLYPKQHPELISKLIEKNITTFSLDLLPRIARAQSMDILSSMSNIAGYKSVILAANHLGKMFPMMTTAAGTVPPVRVIVIGAGVAGLQAIATARRLGAVVIAFDTRPIAGEQVKSLGADFVSLEATSEQSHDTDGYAKEQSIAFYQHEQTVISRYLKEADVVITTALIPGKRAPILITAAMIKEMQKGSVIVDVSVEQQGNCEVSQPGHIIKKHGVTIIGLLNLPSTVPIHASQLYSKNLLSFLNYITPHLKNATLDLSDDVIKNTLISYQGDVVHPMIKDLLREGSSHVA